MNEKERMIALVKQAKLGDAHSFAMLIDTFTKMNESIVREFIV